MTGGAGALSKQASHRRKPWLALLVRACMLFAPVGAAWAQTYVFTPFQAGTFARGVNDAGQVVGTTFETSGLSRATLWQGTTTTFLGTLGGTSSEAWGINASGQVVGRSEFTAGQQRATLWSGATATDLGTLPGGGFSIAYGINSAGQVVGVSGDSSGQVRGTLWNGSVATPLGAVGSYFDQAWRINDSGQAVGWSSNVAGYNRATLWNGATPVDLGSGTEGSASQSFAHGINMSGQVAGMRDSSGQTRAILWNGTTPTDLGPGQALGINDAGLVVGMDSGGAAMLWNGTTATNLNSFLSGADVAAGWRLSYASAISNNGLIVGSAFNDTTGTSHAFLLTPVPEPQTYQLVLTALGVFGLAGCRRRASSHRFGRQCALRA